MKNKPLIIFGIGQVSEILTFYLKKMERNIYAYCVDDKFYKKNFFKDKKVITTQELFKKTSKGSSLTRFFSQFFIL